jgi:acetyl/propionyl-CoA carboxylase alpha subunit/acetyl-CoA carboxylase carboxyltransferase component
MRFSEQDAQSSQRRPRRNASAPQNRGLSSEHLPVIRRLLIANRGEIALRLVRAAADSGIESVAVHADDDADGLHVKLATHSQPLGVAGPAAYLDIAGLVGVARRTGCDAIHPGYGFLSENANFATACAEAGIVFVGPTPEQLALFGDKTRARELALRCGVPVLPATAGAVSLAEADAFFAEQAERGAASVMIKAVGGGGGRGIRAVHSRAGVAEAYERCRSEAGAAFGVDGVYVERLMAGARHVEIQIVGDGANVASLGDRECTLQRRFQKLVEIAPSATLPENIRAAITEAALCLAAQVNYRNLGTFEFLVDADSSSPLPWVFIEANPRLQVEHTVSEAVTGLDLVQMQLQLASGASLGELGIAPGQTAARRGFAVQWRIHAESIDAAGRALPSQGRVERFELPSGPGVRCDTHGFAGFVPSPRYDTLLAKLVVHAPGSDFSGVLRRSRRALAECRIDGIATNLGLLRAIAARPEFERQDVDTRFVEAHLADLLAEAAAFDGDDRPEAAKNAKSAAPTPHRDADAARMEAAGAIVVRAPMAARVVQLEATTGTELRAGAPVAVLEAMKMEHVLAADAAGRVVACFVAAGDQVDPDQALVALEPFDACAASDAAPITADLDAIRADLRRVVDRHAFTLDANRAAAVARRRASGGRTARENVAELCDLEREPGNFIEYGALAVAAQTRRRSLDDLVANTPADGMVTGIGSVNADRFGAERSRCVVLAYDYTVLAGTQGLRNHQKTDRMLGIAHGQRLPVVLFAEGGGGRPGDTDMPIVAGLNNHTFSQFAALSGKVPVVGIVHGRCFAGNAALLGCADVIIATRDSFIGMSGPAMIEGGGLGRFAPEQIGPSEVQAKNGVIDILVGDERAAVAAAKQYLACFQGRIEDTASPDPRELRHAVPENRLRSYNIGKLIHGLVDHGSVIELRAGFGRGMVTALVRIGGRPLGLIANDPRHLGGAIDADAADKAARFMQLCDAHGLPIAGLCDTPGFMVGPDVEARAQVRHASRMFMVASHLRVPYFCVVLRKGYGLGAQAMAAGGFDAPVFTVAWPSGEFGAMGLEGAVKLGFRRELEAAPAGPAREALFEKLVAEQYASGSAIHMAQTLEIDAVIDPAETRAWLLRGLESAAPVPSGGGRYVDAW